MSDLTWQKCPICDGTGRNPFSTIYTPCPICNAKRIISTLNGLPPNYTYKQSSPMTKEDLCKILDENDFDIESFLKDPKEQ